MHALLETLSRTRATNQAEIISGDTESAAKQGFLQNSELVTLKAACLKIASNVAVCLDETIGLSIFEESWSTATSIEDLLKLANIRVQELSAAAAANGVKFSKSAPRWSLILSDAFVDSISKIDKKTQGRILEAMAKITQSPTTVQGDTIKPLTGNHKGLWRYRIGDYRLLYDPLPDNHVALLSFEARGSVYADA